MIDLLRSLVIAVAASGAIALAQESPPAEQEAPPEEEAPEGAASDGVDDVFIPSEELGADEEVTFPVDI